MQNLNEALNDKPKGNMLQNENNEDEATPSADAIEKTVDKAEDKQEKPKETSTIKQVANAINFMIY